MTQSETFFRRNRDRIDKLISTFNSYPNISRELIMDWVDQFDFQDGELALKILENVMFFDQSKIFTAYKSVHQQILEYAQGSLSNVYFFPFGYIGKSGGALTYSYRIANNLTDSDYNDKFLHISEIQDFLLEKPITVFIDDFIGSGNEAVKIWKGSEKQDEPSPPYQGIVPPGAKVLLAVAVAFDSGIEHILEETHGKIQVISSKILDDKHKIFSESNTLFLQKEKDQLLKYCKKTGYPFPTGYGNIQSLIVFHYRCPNDTLPVLWYKSNAWKALFPRFMS